MKRILSSLFGCALFCSVSAQTYTPQENPIYSEEQIRDAVYVVYGSS